MKAFLAEQLLATVMAWDATSVAAERPIIQALADLKYDAYQRYFPGMRFVESFATWLAQFQPAERKIAYDFVKRRLVFFSHEEMAHFAGITYRDFVRPLLIDRVATEEGIPRYYVRRILNSNGFSELQKRTLFLGLSDGARIDMFRRSNRELSHEQIFQSYELASGRLDELPSTLGVFGGTHPVTALVLLDDFSASGTTYFRKNGKDIKGIIAKFLHRIKTDHSWKTLVCLEETMIIVALYVATDEAVQQIRSLAGEFLSNSGAHDFHIRVVQKLPSTLRIPPSSTEPFVSIVNNTRYYDSSLEDESTKKGGTDLRFGYAAGSLPVILHHNTPNNSLFLLWAEDDCTVRGLFPRFSRHKEEG